MTNAKLPHSRNLQMNCIENLSDYTNSTVSYVTFSFSKCSSIPRSNKSFRELLHKSYFWNYRMIQDPSHLLLGKINLKMRIQCKPFQQLLDQK